jgi:hypothetical protein
VEITMSAPFPDDNILPFPMFLPAQPAREVRRVNTAQHLDAREVHQLCDTMNQERVQAAARRLTGKEAPPVRAKASL